MTDPDLITASIKVEAVHQTPGCGRLLALATVAVDLDGIELALHGVQIVRLPTGRLRCQAPQFRNHSGAWLPAVTLPPELELAIGREVLTAGGFMQDSPA